MACVKFNTGFIFLIILAFIICCCEDNNHGAQGISDKMKYRQYMAEGQKLYIQHCGNCHQDDGSGLVRLYPPLKGSGYLSKDLQRSLCIIKFGYKGEIIINGISFNMEMPANKQLTNLDLAEISTYVVSAFSDNPALILPDDIEKLDSECNKMK